jgi:hypothetical protein
MLLALIHFHRLHVRATQDGLETVYLPVVARISTNAHQGRIIATAMLCAPMLTRASRVHVMPDGLEAVCRLAGVPTYSSVSAGHITVIRVRRALIPKAASFVRAILDTQAEFQHVQILTNAQQEHTTATQMLNVATHKQVLHVHAIWGILGLE